MKVKQKKPRASQVPTIREYVHKQTSVESKKTTNRAPPVAIEYANSQWSAQLPKGHPAKIVEKNEVTERLFPNRTSTHVTIMVMSEKPLTTYIYIYIE